MLKTQITGAKYLSPQTNQMTNLNIAVPADSKDTEFGTSDILLAKDTVKIIDDKIANKKSFKFVETLPNKIEDVDPDVIYIVTGINPHTKNVEIITPYFTGGGVIGSVVNDEDAYYEYVFEKYENKRLYYEQLGKSNELPLIKGNNETSVATIRSDANGNFSTALGMGCTTNNIGECAVGQFNRSTESDNTSEKTLFSVGYGSSDQKSNVFEVKANGDIYMLPGSAMPNLTEPFKLNEVINAINDIYDKIDYTFQFVKELPSVEDASTNKIYCVRDPNSTDNENRYIEYVLIIDLDNGGYYFEKIGQFNATPDLSGYAKLYSPIFTGNVQMFHCYLTGNLKVLGTISKNNKNLFFKAEEQSSADRAFATDGSIQPIGTEESFVFTLEDGSTVTKSIRVINTTTTPAT